MCIVYVQEILEANIKGYSLKLTLLALGYYSDLTGECWPSITKIIKVTQLNEKTIRKNLRELEKRGWITNTGKRITKSNSIVWSIKNFIDSLKNNPKNNGL